jgi:hypothetical protein
MFVRDSCSKQLDSDRLAADVPELAPARQNRPVDWWHTDLAGCCSEAWGHGWVVGRRMY